MDRPRADREGEGQHAIPWLTAEETEGIAGLRAGHQQRIFDADQNGGGSAEDKIERPPAPPKGPEDVQL